MVKLWVLTADGLTGGQSVGSDQTEGATANPVIHNVASSPDSTGNLDKVITDNINTSSSIGTVSTALSGLK